MKKLNFIAVSVSIILATATAIVIISFAIMLETNNGVTFAASTPVEYTTAKTGNGYTTKVYSNGHCVGKVRTAHRLPVKFIKSGNLTAKALKARRDKFIIIEVINGECIDSKGNGKTSTGHYISYKRIKGHRKGAKYTTYAVHGNDNSIDNITIRIDIKK